MWEQDPPCLLGGDNSSSGYRGGGGSSRTGIGQDLSQLVGWATLVWGPATLIGALAAWVGVARPRAGSAAELLADFERRLEQEANRALSFELGLVGGDARSISGSIR